MPTGHSGVKKSALISDLRVANVELSDIKLDCTDGISVPASRFLLAARSRVFRSMLYGNFSESKSEAVSIVFRSNVIRALIDYCASDDVPAFAHLNGDEEAEILCGIVNAAHYFELTGLERSVASRLCSRMDERPPISCVVLEEMTEEGTPEGSGSGDGGRFQRLSLILRKRALEVIRHRTMDALLPPDLSHGRGVLSLSAAGISEVISDSDMHADELMLFRCLKKWVDESDALEQTRASQGSGAQSRKRTHGDMTEDRRSVAKVLGSKIDLTRIPPSDLKDFVSNSGLVRREDIASAFEAQALRAENYGLSFRGVRSTSEPKGRVIVRGAGVQEVNGEYVPRGRIDGVMKYSKLGFWKGCEEVFSLFRFASVDGSRRWYISIVPRNFEPGSDDDRDFYFFHSQYDFPFGNGWITKEEGVDPAPICVWEPDNNYI